MPKIKKHTSDPTVIPKLCKDCKYFETVLINQGGTKCNAPQNIDIVSGDLLLVTAYDARATDGLCGRDAVLFVAKS